MFLKPRGWGEGDFGKVESSCVRWQSTLPPILNPIWVKERLLGASPGQSHGR